MSSLSSAADQRRLFAMHFVLRRSVNSSRWKRKTGDRQEEEEEEVEGRKRIKRECAMLMTMDGDMKVFRT